MRFKTALFYNGTIVYYNVYTIGHNAYKIKLDSYNGATKPPTLIELHKEGHSWFSSCTDQELIKELSAAIDRKNN
ncbi:MAG: hypothetical protein ICV53_18620 [Flavisolibacter sp.]|nr:hypothetical protein [Flavisolibacter sp.]MBD0296553.1 hypothetical protein [Flavisolibacter sp.]MBD0350392.1 hypothetical protein [Flavisolibacter sp.]MBD0368104.1 hypothetical protein [Flavisolibacter sp.]